MSGEAGNEGPESHCIPWRASVSRRLCTKTRDTRAKRPGVEGLAWLSPVTLHGENFLSERAALHGPQTQRLNLRKTKPQPPNTIQRHRRDQVWVSTQTEPEGRSEAQPEARLRAEGVSAGKTTNDLFPCAAGPRAAKRSVLKKTSVAECARRTQRTPYASSSAYLLLLREPDAARSLALIHIAVPRSGLPWWRAAPADKQRASRRREGPMPLQRTLTDQPRRLHTTSIAESA